jgi:LysR family transcriptional activator of glutamate synthase operon
MNIEVLKFFLTLSKYRNFTKAAEKCSVSQSTLSKQIAMLEQEIYGITLFDRSKKPTELTVAGEEFLKYARNIVQEYDDMLRYMRKYNQVESNTLRIGSMPNMNRFGFTNLIREFRKQTKEDCTIKTVYMLSSQFLEALDNEVIDIALAVVSSDEKIGNEYLCYSIYRDELYFLVSENHKLSRNVEIKFPEIKNEKFIFTDFIISMHANIIEKLYDIGVTNDRIKSGIGVESIIDAVEDGEFCSILPKCVLDSYKLSGISIIPFDENIYCEISIILRNSSHINPHVRKFIDFSFEYRKDMQKIVYN